MSEWIKCSERLPAEPGQVVFESTSYLVSDGNHVAVVAFERGNGCGKPWAAWNGYGYIRRESITHWQPLPSPPTEA